MLQKHQLQALWDGLHKNDKEILRIMYATDKYVRVTARGVVSLGIWLTPQTAEQHLGMIARRGFLANDPRPGSKGYKAINDNTIRSIVLPSTNPPPGDGAEAKPERDATVMGEGTAPSPDQALPSLLVFLDYLVQAGRDVDPAIDKTLEADNAALLEYGKRRGWGGAKSATVLATALKTILLALELERRGAKP